MWCIVKMEEQWGDIKYVLGPFYNYDDAIERAKKLQQVSNDCTIAIEDEPWYTFEVHRMELNNA